MNTTEVPTSPTTETAREDEWLTPGRFALLLGVLIAATFPGVLLGSTTFIVRDFGLFGYPVAYFHRQCFWRGELPLWNPYSSCGLPFLAQWNTLTLYPLSLIYLLLPLTWSLSFFCLAHLFWGGLGMYFLASRWTRNRLAAGLAGVIFAFNGLSLNALMWPNIEATLGWLPWVVWLVQRAWREGGKTVVWAALAGSMQVLAGGPEPILFTWFILLVLACGDWWQEAAQRRRQAWRFVGTGILVGLVCAVQLLPFLELLRHSQRDTGFGTSGWSMPAWGWASFLVPLFHTVPTSQGLFMQTGQYWTSSYYAGIGTLLLILVALRRARTKSVWLLAFLLGLGLILALGDSGVLLRWLRGCCPAIGFVRYPVKFVVLVLAAAPLLTAFGWAALAKQHRPVGGFEVGCALAILALIGVVAAAAASLPAAAGNWPSTRQNAWMRGAFLVLTFGATVACFRSFGLRRMLFGAGVLLIFWLDLITHMPPQNPSVPRSVYTPGWASARLNLDPRPALGKSRLMLAPSAMEQLKSYAIASVEENYLLKRLAFFADCNLLEGIPQAHGFFSLTPGEANNATVLPYVYTNRDFPALLDLMGVSQINDPERVFDWTPRPTAMPIVTAGQRPVFADDRTAFQAFYETNVDFRRIVILPNEARGQIASSKLTTARILDSQFSNQSIVVRTEAQAPSMIVISQSYYPAWKGSVDGSPARIWRADYAFQAIEVPAGRHEIRLMYHDRRLLEGAILSALGLLSCAGLWALAHLRNTSGQL